MKILAYQAAHRDKESAGRGPFVSKADPLSTGRNESWPAYDRRAKLAAEQAALRAYFMALRPKRDRPRADA